MIDDMCYKKLNMYRTSMRLLLLGCVAPGPPQMVVNRRIHDGQSEASSEWRLSGRLQPGGVIPFGYLHFGENKLS